MNHNQITLDQKTQKRNADHDCLPFICFDGDNVVNKKRVPVRCWVGMGLVVYASSGFMQVRGYSEAMDEGKMIAFHEVMTKCHQYNFPETSDTASG